MVRTKFGPRSVLCCWIVGGPETSIKIGFKKTQSEFEMGPRGMEDLMIIADPFNWAMMDRVTIAVVTA
jgi:hypothetical protein